MKYIQIVESDAEHEAFASEILENLKDVFHRY